MLNNLLSKYFGIGILLSIILAFIFPFTAISLNSFSIVFLFLLMLLSSLNIEWDNLKNVLKNPKELVIGNFLLFLAIPFIVFLIADTLIKDKNYIYGAVFSALTPTAIIAPFFTNILKGNKELSFSLLMTSMILSPFVIPPILTLMVGNYQNTSMTILAKEIVILVPLPILISFILKKYFKPITRLLTDSLPLLNFIFLGLLVFILFGISINNLNFNTTEIRDLSILFIIALIQDFSLLIFIGPLNRYFRNTENTIAIFASASMKNIAIAGSILLLYNPKAAIAPAIGFLAHTILFTPFILSYLIKKGLKY